MSYHGKLQVLKNGTADAEIQLWAYQQIETIEYLYKRHDEQQADLKDADKYALELERLYEDAKAEIEALKQVLQSIANEHVELSHDKIKWQCDDHIRWAKEALK